MGRYSLGSVKTAQAQAVAAQLAAASSSSQGGGDVFMSNISKLRRTWKFAAICQFLFTFEDAFGMKGFKTETLEHDLAAATFQHVPDLMRRLLYTLTLDAKVTTDNWQEYLREQYLWRSENQEAKNPLGTFAAPVDWATLSLATKVRTIHDIIEWQLTDPERFRKLARSDEDSENWRVYPMGWDSKDNTYWLFDDNRLWVQHPPPPPPPPKRPPPKKGSKRARTEAAAAKKARAAAAKNNPGKGTPSTSQTSSAKRTASTSGASSQDTPNKRARTSRSSLASAAAANSPHGTPKREGTRSSRRTKTEDDGWEAIPPELLAQPDQNGSAKPEPNADQGSDLSEPPEEAGPSVKEEEDADADSSRMDVDETETPDGNGEDRYPQVDSDEETWVEFETVAVTRSEWESIAATFAKSRHPDEKALYQLLKDEIVPRVLSDITEAEKQAALDAALAARKRSSRIAMKESEREEKEREAAAKAQMEERMRVIRREEEEKRRKEEEARREETKREDRLRDREERTREREEKLRQRQQEAEEKALRDMLERERREQKRERRKLRQEMIARGEVPPDDETEDEEEADETRQGNDEQDDWDLNCEICLKSGRNPQLVEGEEIVCCESCLVWQHIKCWDAFDAWSRHPVRDWDNVDFFCTECSAKKGLAEPHTSQAKMEEYRIMRSKKKIVLKRTSSGATPGSPSGVKEQPRGYPFIELYPKQSPVPVSPSPQRIASQPHTNGTAAPTAEAATKNPAFLPPVAPPAGAASAKPIVPTTANGGTPNKPLLSPAASQGQPSHSSSAPTQGTQPLGSMGPPLAGAPRVPTERPASHPAPLNHSSPSPWAGRSFSGGNSGSGNAGCGISPPRSPLNTPGGLPSSSSANGFPLGSPTGSTNGSAHHGTTGSPFSSANGTHGRPAKAGAAPTGSFPIRRPNTSVARSPLSGPSISPGPDVRGSGSGNGITIANAAVPPMSLGEALSGSANASGNGLGLAAGAAARGPHRTGSPSPAGTTGAGTGSLPPLPPLSVKAAPPSAPAANGAAAASPAADPSAASALPTEQQMPVVPPPAQPSPSAQSAAAASQGADKMQE